MIKLTKIVATIGPASDREDIIEELVKAGVNVFRFNMKHNTIDWHEKRILLAQKVSDRLKIPIGIMMDLQGSEIRIKTFGNRDIVVYRGDLVEFVSEEPNREKQIFVNPSSVLETLEIGDIVLIDDGRVELVVVEKNGELRAEIQSDGVISNFKGMNLPGKDINLPALVESDLNKLDMVTRNKVDFVALSFTRSDEDIKILRGEMEKRDIQADIVAKVESGQALDNIGGIIEETDVVMVARGDLGIEISVEKLAFWQKKIIRKCILADKPVITATQMLESMVASRLPTRAEATDVANAVLDGTDALMLSGETAAGKYPVRSVEVMALIAKFNEKQERMFEKPVSDGFGVITRAMAGVLRTSGNEVVYLTIITNNIDSVRYISSFRPNMPLFVLTSKYKVGETLALNFAVESRVISGDILRKSVSAGKVRKLVRSSIGIEGSSIVLYGDDLESIPNFMYYFSG